MKVFWSRCGHSHGNFGDKLTPLFLDYLNLRYEWAPPEIADLIGIGSLIEKIPDDYNGVIWTTGCMFENTRKNFPKAEILGLRGKLSLERTLGNNLSNIALGDGGLLCDVFAQPTKKKFKLGVIPHFADQQNQSVLKFAAENPQITIIDVCAPTLEVIRCVGECEHILSSSLHGLILADSLDIPNLWIELGSGTVSGDGFKYRDYYSNFGLQAVKPVYLSGSESLDQVIPGLTDYSRPGIDCVKSGLHKGLAALAERFGGNMAKIKSLPQLLADERDNAHGRETWNAQVRSAIGLLQKSIPNEEIFILIDEEQLRSEVQHATAIPFLERNGEYWGAPEGDDEAIAEWKRLAAEGVHHIVFAWPAFWWLESYPGFLAYLEANSDSVLRNDMLRIFKVRRPLR